MSDPIAAPSLRERIAALPARGYFYGCETVERGEVLALLEPQRPISKVDDLREQGWRVAVHNDYELRGELRTFWLLSRDNRECVKGEGASDAEAVAEILRELERRRGPASPGGSAPPPDFDPAPAEAVMRLRREVPTGGHEEHFRKIGAVIDAVGAQTKWPAIDLLGLNVNSRGNAMSDARLTDSDPSKSPIPNSNPQSGGGSAERVGEPEPQREPDGWSYGRLDVLFGLGQVTVSLPVSRFRHASATVPVWIGTAPDRASAADPSPTPPVVAYWITGEDGKPVPVRNELPNPLAAPPRDVPEGDSAPAPEPETAQMEAAWLAWNHAEGFPNPGPFDDDVSFAAGYRYGLEAQAARLVRYEAALREMAEHPWIPVRVQNKAKRALAPYDG